MAVIPLDNLGLSGRTRNVLLRLGIRTLDDLRAVSIEELAQQRNIGLFVISEIKRVLSENESDLASDTDEPLKKEINTKSPAEATYSEEQIDEMKQYRIKVALSVNPATGVDAVLPYLDQIDMVLVMGVEPGFGGQKLIPQTLEKVKELDRLRKEKGLSYQIELDGGVNRENLAKIIEHGTDIAVAGTAVFRGNIRENVRDLQEVIAGAS